jgi:hypothetical protein
MRRTIKTHIEAANAEASDVAAKVFVIAEYTLPLTVTMAPATGSDPSVTIPEMLPVCVSGSPGSTARHWA